MPDPINSGVSYRDMAWPDLPGERELHDHIATQLDQETYGACRHPRTVLEGVICGDDTAISNACRRAKPGSVDAYVCDDKNLQTLQTGALDIAKKAAWKAIELFFGAKVAK